MLSQFLTVLCFGCCLMCLLSKTCIWLWWWCCGWCLSGGWNLLCIVQLSYIYFSLLVSRTCLAVLMMSAGNTCYFYDVLRQNWSHSRLVNKSIHFSYFCMLLMYCCLLIEYSSIVYMLEATTVVYCTSTFLCMIAAALHYRALVTLCIV